jgi:hypothetical protein
LLDLATLLPFVFTVTPGFLGAPGLKLVTWIWTERQAFFHPPDRVQQGSSLSLSRSL